MKQEIINLLVKIKNGANGTQWLNDKAQPFEADIRGKKKKRVRTEIKAWETLAISSRAKDLFFEQVLDKGEYSISRPLVIRNPYGIAPLSAIVLFNTSQPAAVRCTIHGKNGGEDLHLEIDEKKTRHRIPVVGLYENQYNQITIEVLHQEGGSEKKNLSIKTAPVKKSLRNAVQIRKRTKDTSREYIYVSGGFSQNSYIFDSQGNVRLYLTKKIKAYGTHMLSNGHFLFTEPDIAKPTFNNPHVTIFHEMDFMGRVYRTYQVEKGIHHFVSEKEEGGNFLALSSTLEEVCGMENAIIEIDRQTGDIVSSLSLNTLFDETYQNRLDWAHINSIRYLPEEKSVLVSLRNLHSVAKIRWDTKELVWILGEIEFWKATTMMDKVLKPIGDIKWFYQQHTAELLAQNGPKKEILVFDNHVAVRRKAPLFEPDPHSYLTIFSVDEEEGTVSMDRYFTMDNSEIRSNGVLIPEENRIFGMAGCLRPKIDGFSGMVYEFDYEDGSIVNEYGLKNDFFTGFPIEFQPEDLSLPLEQSGACMVGRLRQPEKISMEEKDFLSWADLKGEAPFVWFMLDDVFLIEQKDHDVMKLYAVGEKHQYVLDESDTVQKSKKFENSIYSIAFPFEHLEPDQYKLYVETKDGIYTIKDSVVLEQV